MSGRRSIARLDHEALTLLETDGAHLARRLRRAERLERGNHPKRCIVSALRLERYAIERVALQAIYDKADLVEQQGIVHHIRQRLEAGEIAGTVFCIEAVRHNQRILHKEHTHIGRSTRIGQLNRLVRQFGQGRIRLGAS